jgi:hypothetical protein
VYRAPCPREKEAAQQPGDYHVVDDPERRVLPVTPIDHGFADAQADRKDERKIARQL